MAGTVDEIIAQLARASAGFSSAAATALRAQQEVIDAHQALSGASVGASAHAVTNATAEWETAADKAGEVARLLMEAVRHLNAYSNRIAPGSAPDEPMLTGPTGEELLADTTRRSDARRGVGSFFNKMARKSEDVQDTGKSMVELGREAIRVLGGPRGPSGAQTSHTGTPSAVVPTHPVRIDPPEAGGHILILGLIAGITVNRAVNVVATTRQRYADGHELPALAMEGMIRGALGEADLPDDIAPDVAFSAQIVILGTLLQDEQWTETELEEFIREVEQTAAQYM